MKNALRLLKEEEQRLIKAIDECRQDFVSDSPLYEFSASTEVLCGLIEKHGSDSKEVEDFIEKNIPMSPALAKRIKRTLYVYVELCEYVDNLGQIRKEMREVKERIKL